MIEFSLDNDGTSPLSAANPTVIRIIGCGGGGSSAVNRLIASGVSDVEYIVLNTDLQALNVSKAQKRIPIGQKLTGGLGAGGNPAVGENAAKEDSELISNIINGANMVIITAGMGGGTGTGSAPIVAKLAKEAGALTIAVVTTPFGFEAEVRMKNAMEGLKKLRENVDSLIVIPNEQIMRSSEKAKTMNYRQAFQLADDVLCQGVRGISEIITKPGDINLDFADVKSVMKDQGEAILGVGVGEGENRAVDAAQTAISNPLLESRQIDGASKILVNITSNGELGITEVQEIVNNIKASASKNVEVFFGLVTDPNAGDKINVTVIATGFKEGFDDTDSYEKAAETPENDNIMSHGDFVKIIHGKTGFGQKDEEPAAETPKMSMFSASKFDQQLAFDESEKAVFNQKEEAAPAEISSFEDTLRKAQNAAVNNGIEPPAGYKVNSSDLQQPACWRQLDGLSRTINLSDE